MKSSTLILSFFLFLLSTSVDVYANYEPAITYEKYIKTITVNKDGTYEEIIEEQDLIETQKGVVNFNQSDLSYTKGMQSLEILDAYIVKPDGKKIKVTKENIRYKDDPIDGGSDIFTDTKHTVIIFPDVSIGSRIYSKVKFKTFKTQFKNQFFLSEFVTPHYKFNIFEVNLIVDKNLKLNFDNKGFVGGLIKTTDKQNIYKYSYKQDQVFPSEEDMVGGYDFAPYLIASTLSKYEEIGNAYQKIAHPKAKPTPIIQGTADMIIAQAGGGDKKAEAKAIYEWVVKNIRYVAVYVGNGGIEPHSAESILRNSYGDCKDHVVILESLLAARGIESSPVLVNSGNTYTLPKYPVISPHNHAISYIPQFDMYLDSTSKSTPFGSIPFGVRDKPVVLAALKKVSRTPTMVASENIVTSNIKMQVQDDGYIYGTSHTKVTGPTEAGYRANQKPNIGREKQVIVKEILDTFGETGVGELYTTDPYNFDIPYEENSTFTLDPISNIPGPGAMKIPVGVSQGRIYIMSKQKPLEKRNFDYVCGSRTYVENYEITFPENIKITSIPKGISYSKNGMSYLAEYKKNKETVYVKREMILDSPSMTCSADKERMKKEYFEILQKDFRSQIIYN